MSSCQFEAVYAFKHMAVFNNQASIEKPEFHETLKQRQIYRASFTVQTKPQGWTILDLHLDQTRWHRRWLDCLKKWFRMQLVSFRNTAWNIDSFFHFRVSALRYCARRTVLGNLGPVWRTPTVTFPFLLSSSVVFCRVCQFLLLTPLTSMYHALYTLLKEGPLEIINVIKDRCFIIACGAPLERISTSTSWPKFANKIAKNAQFIF